jgi:hypothetical protein
MTVAKKASAGLRKSEVKYSAQHNAYLTRRELKDLEEKEKYINTLWDLGLTDVPESLPMSTMRKMIEQRVAENKIEQGITESEYVELKPRPKMRAK